RIERYDLGAFDNDTRVAQDVAASVQQHRSVDDDAPLLCLGGCGIRLRSRANDEYQEAEDNSSGSHREQPRRNLKPIARCRVRIGSGAELNVKAPDLCA